MNSVHAGDRGGDQKILGTSPAREDTSLGEVRTDLSTERLTNGDRVAAEEVAPPYSGPLTKFTYQRAR